MLSYEGNGFAVLENRYAYLLVKVFHNKKAASPPFYVLFIGLAYMAPLILLTFSAQKRALPPSG